MSPPPRPARFVVSSLIAAIVLATVTVGPAAAQDGDQGELELFDEPQAAPTAPAPPGPLDLTVPEAEAVMDEMLAEHAWDLPVAVEDDATAQLFLEIALLTELRAFDSPGPNAFTRIHSNYAPWPAVGRNTLLAALEQVDTELATVKNSVDRFAGARPDLAPALGRLRTDQREQLEAGNAAVPSEPYGRALSMLLSAGTADELARRDLLGAEMIAELGPALTALGNRSMLTSVLGEEPIEPPPPPSRGTDDAFPWLLALGTATAMAVVGTALIAWALQRRRQSRPDASGDDGLTDAILEAHRLLTGAVDEDDIADIGCATAVAVTAAHDALMFRREADGLRMVGTPEVIVRSVLDRVIETGQALFADVDDDPALGGPASILGVPLVADGVASAVLVVRGNLAQGFDQEDRRRLELLAPALAGALTSADTLGSFEQMAMVDGLTALGNRRRLDGDLAATLADADARNLPVAFAMVDIDDFKLFNDTHGHEAGDHALQRVAQVIADVVRATDIVYRYGGEEFSILLPGATAEEAAEVAERIRIAVQHARIPGRESQPGGRLTISVGVSSLDVGDSGSLKRRADGALYEAKAQGRNRCVTA